MTIVEEKIRALEVNALHDAGDIRGIVRALTLGDEETKACAAEALINLTADNKEKQSLVAAGIGPLIELLQSTLNVKGQEHAGNLLCNLAKTPENRKYIVEAGSIEPLVALLNTQNVTGKAIRWLRTL